MRERIPPVVWLLTIGNGLFALIRFMVMPFLAIYVRGHTGASAAVVGVVIGLAAASNLVFSFILGPLSDRIGRKPSLVAGALVSALGLLAFRYAHTLLTFAALQVLFGITQALELPAYPALITDVTPPRLRLRAFGYMWWAGNAGAAIGALLGGVAGSGHSMAPFLISGAAGLVLTLALVIALPRAAGRTPDRPVSSLESLRHLRGGLRNRRLVWLLLGLLFVSLSYSQIDTSLAQYLGLRVPDGTRLYALMWAVNALTVVALQPILVRFQEASAPARTIVGGAIVYSVSTLALILAGAAWTWIVIMVFFTFGELLVSPAQQTAVAELAPEDRRAAYFTLQNIAMGLALTFGPVAGGAALEAGGRVLLFSGMAAVNALAAVAFFLATQRGPRAAAP